MEAGYQLLEIPRHLLRDRTVKRSPFNVTTIGVSRHAGDIFAGCGECFLRARAILERRAFEGVAHRQNTFNLSDLLFARCVSRVKLARHSRLR